MRPGSPWITVIGIIANARTESLARAEVPQLYLNLYQTGAKHLAILLRGHLDTAGIADEVRNQVQSLDPTLPVFGAQTLSETVSASLSQRRFSLEVIALFALTALLLASIGVYGVISYLVTERPVRSVFGWRWGHKRGTSCALFCSKDFNLQLREPPLALFAR